MKKLLSLALVLAMVLTISVTAFAQEITGNSGSTTLTYTVSESYIVTIPDSMSVGTDANVSVKDVVLASGKELTVSVSSKQYNDGWKLKNGDDTIGYTLKIGDTTIANNDTVLTVKSGETATKTLQTALTGTAKYSGNYTDTLTFTVAAKFAYNATSVSAAELKTALTAALQSGETDLDITLAADADQTMTAAIFEAITESAAADGSISLTLRGITTIAESAFYHYGEGEFSWDIEANTVRMKQVGALTLTDVTAVEESGFEGCNNLTSLTAPKLQTLGDYAFSEHKLSVIDLPEATKLGFAAFESTIATVTKVDLPKVTEIRAFALGAQLKYADGAEVILTGLTADFIFNNWYDTSTYTDFISTLQMENINLKLNSCMQGQVSGNTWTIPRESGDPILRTFKSIILED